MEISVFIRHILISSSVAEIVIKLGVGLRQTGGL
jgi:hypothetical protein